MLHIIRVSVTLNHHSSFEPLATEEHFFTGLDLACEFLLEETFMGLKLIDKYQRERLDHFVDDIVKKSCEIHMGQCNLDDADGMYEMFTFGRCGLLKIRIEVVDLQDLHREFV